MPDCRRILAAGVTTALLCLSAPAVSGAEPALAKAAPAGPFSEVPATRETLRQMRAGGFTLYLRHGTTDNSRPDRAPAIDLNDCGSQRPLNEDGRKLSARVGNAVRNAGIPVGDIHVSPLCRVKDTAEAAFPGRSFSIDNQLMYTANLTDAQKTPIIANTRRLLSAPVVPGSNRLVIAHAPNLMDLIGYFPKEATLVIFRPRTEGAFDYVASIPPSLWAELLH